MSDTPVGDDVAAAPALPWPVQLPWQQSTLAALASQRAALPHALLIHGHVGIGKHALALHLAQALLCERPHADGIACGACAGCHYAVAGQHPDLMRLELFTLDDESAELVRSETIPVERVRALIDFVQLTSHRQGVKVAVIAPADRMNVSAVNALLKTLEEPPPRTHLLLVTDQPRRLLPTVVSRCRMVLAPAPTDAEARAWLSAQGVREPESLLAQAGGAPLAALAIADPAQQQERKVWLTALADPDRLSAVQLAARIDAAGRDERKARLASVVEWLLAWTADLARVARGGSPVRNIDFGRALPVLAPRVAPPALFRYHRSLLQQRILLQHPLQPRLVAEALLLDYRSLFRV
jgi:DNA polymerase-3 subunit delta'